MSLPQHFGRFVVERELGTGSFSTVALAWDTDFESSVAFKVLHAKYVADHPEVAARFVEEARILRRIRSYSVVDVHDIGRLPDGRPYLVMEYADLGTLGDSVREAGGPVSEATLIELLDALADGVSAIHRAGVVHRDLKPENILRQSVGRPMRWRREEVEDTLGTDVVPAAEACAARSRRHEASRKRFLVADLGIAEDARREGRLPRLTGGTRGFRAPEQMDAAAEVHPSADIYGASAVLFYSLTGEVPPETLQQTLERVGPRWRPLFQAGLALEPDERPDSIEAWRDLVMACLSERPPPTTPHNHKKEELPPNPVCPYLGLDVFQRDDAHRFFGRENLIEEVLAMLRHHAFVVVGGPSGSGKSSLVRAGVAAALAAGQLAGSEAWSVEIFTPGRDPLAELYARMSRLGESAGFSLDDFIKRPSLAGVIGAAGDRTNKIVLIIDQFEELFTLNERVDLDRFVEALAALTDPADSKYRIVVTVRADFYGSCASVPWLADWISRSQLLVGPMTKAELRRAILEPARAFGYKLERSLVDAIVDEAGGEAGSLPLISHALAETWARRDGNLLTLEGYRATGGVAGAIRQTADDVFAEKLTDEERETAKQLLMTLVTPGEGTSDTRRILSLEEVDRLGPAERMRRVVSVLTRARLLTVGDATVQITHEALISSWPRLRMWIARSREDIRIRLRLNQLAEEWLASGRDEEMLLRSGRLSGSLEWSEQNPLPEESLEREFLKASAAARALRRRRTRRIQVAVFAGLSALAIGASAASIVALRALGNVAEQRTIAENALSVANQRLLNLLSSGALEHKDSDPLLAIAMAAEAISRLGDDPSAYDAKVALFAARDNLSRPGPVPLGGPVFVGDALSLALSEDGALAAVGRRDGQVLLLDADGRLIIEQTLATPAGGIEDLHFDPLGRTLLAVSNGGEIIAWPLEGRSLDRPQHISSLPDVIWRADLSPDGLALATASEDGTLRIFDLERREREPQVITRRSGDYTSVAFPPGGGAIVAGNGRGEVAAWKVPEGTSLFGPLRGIHSSDVWGLAFNSRGDRIATVSSDGTSALISYPEGRPLGRNFASEGITAVAFVPQSENLLAGTTRGDLLEWDVETRKQIAASSVGHRGHVADVELSRDGSLAVSLGSDQNLRFWRLSDGPPLGSLYEVSGAAAKGIAIGEDVVVSGDDAGQVLVFRRGGRVASLMWRFSHESAVWATAVSPDGALAASGDRSGRLTVHDLSQGRTVADLQAHDGSIWSVGFMPDGATLYTAGSDVVRLWSTKTWQIASELTLPGTEFTRADVSPDGSILAASTTGGEAVLWPVGGQGPPRRIAVDDNTIWSVRFSHDGTRLAAASSDEVVSIWDVASGDRLAEFPGHFGGATDVVFLDDDHTVVGSDRRGSLHFWDVPTQRRIRQLTVANHEAIWRLASLQGSAVLAGTADDGRVQVWDVLDLERGCELARGSFDAANRRLYLGNENAVTVCE